MIAAQWNYKQRHSKNGSIPYRMSAAIADSGDLGSSSCSVNQLSVVCRRLHASHSTVCKVEGSAIYLLSCGDQIKDETRCWMLLCVVCTVSLREGGFGSVVRLFGWFDSVFLAD